MKPPETFSNLPTLAEHLRGIHDLHPLDLHELFDGLGKYLGDDLRRFLGFDRRLAEDGDLDEPRLVQNQRLESVRHLGQLRIFQIEPPARFIAHVAAAEQFLVVVHEQIAEYDILLGQFARFPGVVGIVCRRSGGRQQMVLVFIFRIAAPGEKRDFGLIGGRNQVTADQIGGDAAEDARQYDP